MNLSKNAFPCQVRRRCAVAVLEVSRYCDSAHQLTATDHALKILDISHGNDFPAYPYTRTIRIHHE